MRATTAIRPGKYVKKAMSFCRSQLQASAFPLACILRIGLETSSTGRGNGYALFNCMASWCTYLDSSDLVRGKSPTVTLKGERNAPNDREDRK